MKRVVVGGQSRNIGKTSLAVSLISAMPELDWTAVKVTLFGHGICSQDGRPCDCAVDDPDHPFLISRETDSGGSSDTSRMLQAGARKALWVRAPQGRLGEAMPALEAHLRDDEHVLFESNSVLDFFTPDLYVVLLDPGVEDFKPSALRLLGRADAFAVSGSTPWPDPLLSKVTAARPVFPVAPPLWISDKLAAFARDRLTG